jgi:hypothetical protein
MAGYEIRSEDIIAHLFVTPIEPTRVVLLRRLREACDVETLRAKSDALKRRVQIWLVDHGMLSLALFTLDWNLLLLALRMRGK